MATRQHIYRHAGKTYLRISCKAAAKELEKNPDLSWFLVGARVHPSQFFEHWCLAYLASLEMERRGVMDCKQEFEWYLDKELGRYAICYLEVKQ